MIIHSFINNRPNEKEYMMKEIIGLCCGSLEVSLVVPALFSLRNGIRGVYTVLMIIQYLVYRNGIDANVAVRC